MNKTKWAAAAALVVNVVVAGSVLHFLLHASFIARSGNSCPYRARLASFWAGQGADLTRKLQGRRARRETNRRRTVGVAAIEPISRSQVVRAMMFRLRQPAKRKGSYGTLHSRHRQRAARGDRGQ